MKGYAVTGLALALLLGGVRADDKADKARAVKEEWERLNGTWEAARRVVDGKEVPAPGGRVVTLKDGKGTLKEGGKVVGEATVKLDPTATPKSLDILPSSGPNKGKTLLGIYEVKGDTYQVCIAPAGKPRPKAFGSAKGSGHDLITYKRAKAR